jgi:DNA-binding CsgD family transcriptional regulator
VDLLVVREAQLEGGGHPFQSQSWIWMDFSGFFRCSLSAKTAIPIVIADQDILVDSDVLTLASMAVVTNTAYRSPTILRHLNSSEPYGFDQSGQTFQLTPRERQLLEAYALGLSNQETAQRLGLSVRTVQTYSSNLLQKLGVNNRQKALRRAISLGFNAVLQRFDPPE